MDDIAWEELADLRSREIERLQAEIKGLRQKASQAEDLERRLQEETDARLRLEKALEQIAPHGYGLDQNATDEERADYWSGLALRYRRIAREALNWTGKTADTAHQA